MSQNSKLLSIAITAIVVVPHTELVAQPPFPKPPAFIRDVLDGKKPESPDLEAIVRGLKSSGPFDRLQAAEKLTPFAEQFSELVASKLTTALDDQNDHVRFATLDILAGMGSDADAAYDRVVQQIPRASTDFEKILAINAAKRIRPDAVDLNVHVPLLIAGLQSKEEETSQRASAALELFEAADAGLAELLNASSDDEILKVRLIELLGKSGSGTSVGALQKQLKSDQPSVRMSAATSLGRLGCSPNPAVDAVSKLTVDGDAGVRLAAISALASMSPPDEVLNQLQNVVNDDEEIVVAQRAAEVVVANSDPKSAGKVISQLFNDERPEIVVVAMAALSDLEADAVPIIRDVLEEPKSQIPVVMAAAELEDDARPLIPDLLALLKTDDDALQLETLITLGRIGGLSSADADKVLPLIQSDPLPVRRAAVYVIVRADSCSANAKRVLATQQESDDAILRLTATWASAKHSPSPIARLKAVKELASAAASDDQNLRATASHCLADLGEDFPVPPPPPFGRK